VLDFTPSVPELLGPVEQAPGVWYYPAPAPEFALWRVEVERASAELPRTDVGRILLVTDGSVMIKAGADSLELRRGESALITAGEYAELTGSGTAFIGSPGVS
jgi:mannose-6-phosphate isomerase